MSHVTAIALIAITLLSANVAVAEIEYSEEFGRTYGDLTNDEKAALRRLKFLRKACFFKRLRDGDDGIIAPQELANSVVNECSEHENVIRLHLEKLFMSEEFIHDYIRTIQEDVLVSLVPYVLKHRNEQRKLLENLQ